MNLTTNGIYKNDVINIFLPNNKQLLIDRFIAFQDVSDRSKRTYRKAIKQFFIYLQNNFIAHITRDDILSYKRSLHKYSAYTITSYITVVRKFFDWTEFTNIYPNIAKYIKGVTAPKGFRKECLTVDQINRLLNSISRTTLRGKRDYAIVTLLIHTGLRSIEVTRCDISDIKQEGGEALLYVQGKGCSVKDDVVLLTDSVLNPIRAYLSERQPNDKSPLFASLSDRNREKRLTTRSIRRLVKEHLRHIDLDSPKLTTHSFRHTAITMSLLGGATVQEAQTLARHKNINTTMIYSHNIDRVKNAPERKIEHYLKTSITP